MNETSADFAVRTLALALDDLDPEMQHAIDLGDVEELARLHLSLTESKRRLGVIASAVEQALFDVMPDKRLELPGLPVMEKRSSKTRKDWQSAGLLDRLCDLATVDPATGEVLPVDRGYVDRLQALLLDCAPFTSSMGWRVSALRSLGFDVDEWCSTGPGRSTVQIHHER